MSTLNAIIIKIINSVNETFARVLKYTKRTWGHLHIENRKNAMPQTVSTFISQQQSHYSAIWYDIGVAWLYKMYLLIQVT